jgi:spore coat polysaccharide biosynthesis predicted glycosyltransferase SpsG
LRPSARMLAMIDGDSRGIDADLFVDANLGATPSVPSPRALSGPDFALIRDAVLRGRRADVWHVPDGGVRTLAFMGGSDPLAASLPVARALASILPGGRVTVVAPPSLHSEVLAVLGSTATVREPTPELPSLLASADLVIAAGGTSAWDICAMGIPALLIALVDNQVRSVRAAGESGIALTVDAALPSSLATHDLTEPLSRLATDEELRRALSMRARATFDGKGKARIVDRMESE